jgi:hypothetical protein
LVVSNVGWDVSKDNGAELTIMARPKELGRLGGDVIGRLRELFPRAHENRMGQK